MSHRGKEEDEKRKDEEQKTNHMEIKREQTEGLDIVNGPNEVLTHTHKQTPHPQGLTQLGGAGRAGEKVE